MLTGKLILDSVFARLRDNSSGTRTKLLSILQEIGQQAFLEHDWIDLLFLTAGVAPVNNAVLKTSLPNYGRFYTAKQSSTSSSDGFLLKERDQLTEDEIFATGEETVATDRVPAGWHEDATSIYFLPGVTGNIDFKYYRTIPAFTDDSEVTIWPDYFLPLFVRSLLTNYYEFDRDDRLIIGVQLDVGELNRIKKWQNKRKAVPKNDSRGLIRSS
jgi:hypothetical protein